MASLTPSNSLFQQTHRWRKADLTLRHVEQTCFVKIVEGLRPVNCPLRFDPPDEMVVVVGEPDRAVVEVNRVAAAAVPLRDDAVCACVDLR